MLQDQTKSVVEICEENRQLRVKLHNATVSLRDQFAMALNWRTKDTLDPSPKDHASQAYRYADAMIEKRKEPTHD